MFGHPGCAGPTPAPAQASKVWPRCSGDPAFHHEREDESPGAQQSVWLSAPLAGPPSPLSNDVTASSKMFSKKNPVTKSLTAQGVVMLPRHQALLHKSCCS